MGDEPPDWRTDTAERPRVRAAQPSPAPSPARPPPWLPSSAVGPPGPPRWPLYADEQPPPAEAEPEPAPASWSYAMPPPPDVGDDWFASAAALPEDDRGSPLVWVLVTVAVVTAAVLGWWFLGRAS